MPQRRLEVDAGRQHPGRVFVARCPERTADARPHDQHLAGVEPVAPEVDVRLDHAAPTENHVQRHRVVREGTPPRTGSGIFRHQGAPEPQLLEGSLQRIGPGFHPAR